METKQERFQRESKHFKKQMKKYNDNHKRNKAKRLIEQIEQKNWKNNILNTDI